jgi:hypothetical protein
MSATAPRPAARRMPAWPVAAAQLAALWSFAFVQPLFDLLSHNADFFVARNNTAGDILRFAFGMVIVPPAALVAAEALVGRASQRARWALHLGLVAILAGAFALGLAKRALPGQGDVLLAVAAAAGVAFGAGYAYAPAVRAFVTVLAPAPLIFLVLFLGLSPVAELLRPEPAVGAASGPPGRTPIVLAIFDELPTISLMGPGRRLDAERYHAFARLARESTWYRNATTVSDSTPRAVPAILTGLRPNDERRLATSGNFPHSVFTLLGGRWDQHVLEPITDICPPDVCAAVARAGTRRRMAALASDLGVVSGHLLLPDDLAGSLPPIDRGWADFAGTAHDLRRKLAQGRPRGDWWAQRVAEAEHSIAAVRRQVGRPPLHVIHFVAPHVPWRYLPSGLRYPDPRPKAIPGAIPDHGWGPDHRLVRQGWQRHLLQVGFTDRLLGRLIHNLERAGLWDRALVVVVADHGGSFRPAEARRPVDPANFADIAGVPLFVKRPFQHTGRVDDRPARTIDVLPTIAQVVGAGRGWRFDGTPVDAPHPQTTVRVNNHNENRDVTLGVRAFLRQRDAQLTQQVRVFPPGPDALLRLGPNAHLIGRRVADFTLLRGEPGGSVDHAEAYRSVDPRSGVIPAVVAGRVGPGDPAGLPLAIAIDERIRAVTWSYREDGQTRFSAVVPAASLPAGSHTVEVLGVGRRDALRSIARAGA